jgi:hypothetical protein
VILPTHSRQTTTGLSLRYQRAPVISIPAGAVVLAISWFVASGTASVRNQTTWMAIGVLAVVEIGLGSFGVLLVARRKIVRRCAELLDAIDHQTELAARGAAPAASLPVAIDGSPRYHASTCMLVVGKSARAAAGSVHQHAGRRPCEICQP